MLLTFITTSLLGPVGAIALCLFYIDERVRKEGFDVELLMLRVRLPRRNRYRLRSRRNWPEDGELAWGENADCSLRAAGGWHPVYDG